MSRPPGIPLCPLDAEPLRELERQGIAVSELYRVLANHPAALAAWVLRDQVTWTPDRISATMAGPTMTRVPLARPIPVMLFYTTAVVEPDGTVSFYADIYGHDGRLDRALRAGPRP